jgi:hypothetical protein
MSRTDCKTRQEAKCATNCAPKRSRPSSFAAKKSCAKPAAVCAEACTQTSELREDATTQTIAPLGAACPTQAVGTQTEGRSRNVASTQTESLQQSDASTHMERVDVVADAVQTDAVAIDELQLVQLLRITVDKTLTLDLGSRKVTLHLQEPNRVVVRTGGGFIKLSDFMKKYAHVLADAPVLSPRPSGELGTVRRGTEVCFVPHQQR